MKYYRYPYCWLYNFIGCEDPVVVLPEEIDKDALLPHRISVVNGNFEWVFSSDQFVQVLLASLIGTLVGGCIVFVVRRLVHPEPSQVPTVGTSQCIENIDRGNNNEMRDQEPRNQQSYVSDLLHCGEMPSINEDN